MIDDFDTIVSNSFQNFHAKGLDYLCLRRSEELTLKAYFYQNPDAKSPEVVCPHDHRYPFLTTIVAGESTHIRYREYQRATPGPSYDHYQQFLWRTPLNGGDGFTWDGRVCLSRRSTEEYKAGESYFCRADEIHTISISRPDTVLLLWQYKDVLPVGTPSRTFVWGDDREPPSLKGLYENMRPDYARSLLRRLRPITDKL
jgi:hypothetical protein